MPSDVPWIVLGFTAQVGVGVLWPKRIGRGLISRKFWLRLLPMFDDRIAGPTLLRLCLLLAWFGFWWAIDASDTVYWIPVAVHYLDDAIFGDDDDRWKRRWEAVKNKLRWKMKLPVPQHSPQ